MSLTRHAVLWSLVLLCFGTGCKKFTSEVKEDTTDVEVNIVARPMAFIPPELRDWHLVQEESIAGGSIKVFLKLANAVVTADGVCYVAEFLAVGGGSKSQSQAVTGRVSAGGGGRVEVEGVLAVDLCFASTNEASPLSFRNVRWTQSPRITRMQSWGGASNRAARWRLLPRLVARIAGNVARKQAATQTAQSAAQALAAMQRELPGEVTQAIASQLADAQVEAREFLAQLKEYLGGSFQVYQDGTKQLLIIRVEGEAAEARPPRLSSTAMQRHVALQVSEEWLQKRLNTLSPINPNQVYTFSELVAIQSDLAKLAPTGAEDVQTEEIEVPAIATYLRIEFPTIDGADLFSVKVAKDTCQLVFPARLHLDLRSLAQDFLGYSPGSQEAPVMNIQVSLCLREELGSSLATDVKVEPVDENAFYEDVLSRFSASSTVILGLFRNFLRDTLAAEVERRVEELIPRHFEMPAFRDGNLSFAATELAFTDQFVTVVYEEGPPTIGITYRREVSSAGEFFRVLSVTPGSKAALAGLKPHDFLETLGGRKAREISDLGAFIASAHHAADKQLQVSLQRYDWRTKKHELIETALDLTR